MSALAAGMITTAELIGILKGVGISVSILGAGAFLVKGVKVVASELERMAKEKRKCLRCNSCTGYQYNIVSSIEKLGNVWASTFMGAKKDKEVAFRNCICGHHINYHQGH